jgi:hypothetical protein
VESRIHSTSSLVFQDERSEEKQGAGVNRILILLASLVLLSSSAWSAGTFKVTTPNGGQKWTAGKSYTVKWSKGSAGATVKIQLLKSGKHYKWVSKKTKNDGKHTWKIPSTVVTSSAYKIKIISIKNKKIFDTSNKTFKITKAGGGDGGGGSLKVTSPNGGQKWSTGKTYQIKWSKGTAGAKVKIQLLKDGKAYKWISKSTKNDGKHTWKIPATVATASTYKVKITSTSKKTVTDSSNKNFKITKAATSKPTISLSCTPSSASESRGKFTCTLSLSQSTTKSVKVGLAYSGTATAGTDYSGHYASRTIPKGKTSAKWKLTGKADSETEGNETIIINVTSVTNATEQGTQKASLVLTDKTSAIKVTSPNGGESWKAGSTYEISWNKGNGGAYVKILLYKADEYHSTITRKTLNSGSGYWTISTAITAAGSNYKILVQSFANSAIYDASDKAFTIKDSLPDGDYQYLCNYNRCADASNRPIRWPSKTINVYGAYTYWASGFNLWKPLGFRFNHGASGGITLEYSATMPVGTCGSAQRRFYSNGQLNACRIKINYYYPIDPGCAPKAGGEAQTVAHELGHCLGIQKHTSDGGLMDSFTGSTTITTPVKNMLSLLYSIPVGTDIGSKLTSTSSTAGNVGHKWSIKKPKLSSKKEPYLLPWGEVIYN